MPYRYGTMTCLLSTIFWGSVIVAVTVLWLSAPGAEREEYRKSYLSVLFIVGSIILGSFKQIS